MSSTAAFPPTSGLAPGAARSFALPAPFRLQGGGELVGAVVAAETWGELNAARDNAVLVFTGLSVGAHAASHGDDPPQAGGKSRSAPARRSTRTNCSSSA